jgi:preprotein translocase subunit SecF
MWWTALIEAHKEREKKEVEEEKREQEQEKKESERERSEQQVSKSSDRTSPSSNQSSSDLNGTQYPSWLPAAFILAVLAFLIIIVLLAVAS